MSTSRFKFTDYQKKKGATVGYISLVIYLAFMGIVYYYSIQAIIRSSNNWSVILYIAFSLLTQTLFFYPGIFCLITTLISIFLGKKSFKFSTSIYSLEKFRDLSNAKIAILYVTKDDFINDAALTMLNQQTLEGKTNKNWVPYILDDSTKEQYIKAVDEFAKRHNVKVIRRGNNGPRMKCGNINYFLENYLNNFDYFVILDSDTYIEDKWCANAIQYFERFKDIGIVQGLNSIISHNKNLFQDIITPNDKQDKMFWAMNEEINNLYSTTPCSGHACMLSNELIKKNDGKFKKFISEDWSIFIDAKKLKYECSFTSNCIAKEENPPNYYAYKKRHLRWEDGNFQIFHSYFFKIMFSGFRFWQKWNIYNMCCSIFLTTLNFFVGIILTYLMMFFIPSNLIYTLFPYFVFAINIVLYVLSITTVPGKAVVSKQSVSRAFLTSFSSAFVVTSLMPSFLIEYFMLLLGKKITFKVTIKENKKITFKDFVKGSWMDLLIWTLMLVYIFAACWYGNAWFFLLNPWMIVVLLSIISIFIFPFLSNIPLKK